MLFSSRVMVMFLLTIFFIASRVVFLDADLPAVKVSSYYPLDEAFYADKAFNLYLHGDINDSPVAYLDDFHGLENPAQTLVTWGTLTVFGNTYYGLRMASVLASLGSFLLLLHMAWRALRERALCQHDARSRLVAVAVIGLVMLGDFAFNLSGRVVEPTVFRYFLMLLVFYLASVLLQKTLFTASRSMLLGAVAMLGVVLSYKTNFFLLPAVLTTLGVLQLTRGWRCAGVQLCWCLGGMVLVFILFSWLSWQFMGSWWGDEQSLRYVQSFSSKLAFSGDDFLSSVVANALHFVSTHIFHYNPFLLFLFLLVVPVLSVMAARSRRMPDVLLLSFTGFLFLQSLFINDYYQRKLIILFPLVCLLLVRIYFYRYDIAQYIRQHPAHGAGYGLLMLCVFFLLDGSTGWIKYLSYFSIMMVVVVLVLWFYGRARPWHGVLAVVFFMLPNMILNLQFIYASPSYQARDSMQALARMLPPNELIPGSYHHGMRLYNSFTPLMNSYVYFSRGSDGRYFLSRDGKGHYQADFARLLKDEKINYALFSAKSMRNMPEKRGIFVLKARFFMPGIGAYGLYHKEGTPL